MQLLLLPLLRNAQQMAQKCTQQFDTTTSSTRQAHQPLKRLQEWTNDFKFDHRKNTKFFFFNACLECKLRCLNAKDLQEVLFCVVITQDG